MTEINEMIIAFNTPDDPGSGGGGSDLGSETEKTEKSGTVILDATCAQRNIRYL